MAFLADILFISGAVALAIYCMILSRRLRRLNDLESGVGGAVATLAIKADDLGRTLKSAQFTATDSIKRLDDVTERAEDAARHLEILVASLHSLPTAKPKVEKENPFFAHRQEQKEMV